MTTLADFDQTVLEVIGDVGTTMTYLSTTQGVYDPATASVGRSMTPVQVLAFVADLMLQSNGVSTKYGIEVQTGDKEAFFVPPVKRGGLPLVIDTVNDQFVLPNGDAYTVQSFREVNPSGGDPVLYSVYLRK